MVKYYGIRKKEGFTFMKKGLNAFHLKLIAIIAMFINHLGTGLPIPGDHPYWFLFKETAGRLTMPIMAFLLVEGIRHTRNWKKYALRLLVFGLISALPFHVFFNHTSLYLLNNIFFALLMALLMLVCLEKISQPVVRILIIAVCALISAKSDWPYTVVMVTAGFYLIRGRYTKVIIPLFLASLAWLIYLLHLNFGLTHSLTMFGFMLCAPLLLAYNGERGPSNAVIKWSFYVFYPVHLLFIMLLRAWLHL